MLLTPSDYFRSRNGKSYCNSLENTRRTSVAKHRGRYPYKCTSLCKDKISYKNRSTALARFISWSRHA